MSVPAKKNSRSKVRRRRSHHALSQISINICKNCAAPTFPHRACKACGQYKGKQVIKGGIKEVEKVLEKKANKNK